MCFTVCGHWATHVHSHTCTLPAGVLTAYSTAWPRSRLQKRHQHVLRPRPAAVKPWFGGVPVVGMQMQGTRTVTNPCYGCLDPFNATWSLLTCFHSSLKHHTQPHQRMINDAATKQQPYDTNCVLEVEAAPILHSQASAAPLTALVAALSAVAAVLAAWAAAAALAVAAAAGRLLRLPAFPLPVMPHPPLRLSLLHRLPLTVGCLQRGQSHLRSQPAATTARAANNSSWSE